MRKRLKFGLGSFTVFLLALMPSVVPVGASIAPATAADCSPTETTFTGYQVLTFTSVGDCDWRVPSGVVSVDYLLVGGGGSGGSSALEASAGGGGGGQVVEQINSSVAGGALVTISVGSGGSATLTRGAPDAGGDGSASSLTGGLSDSALGGSGGANARPWNATQGQASNLGWSGGGGSVHASNGSTGSTGPGGAGSKGGDAWFDGASADPQAGGGGGGAGGAGTNATANVAGDGGAGVESSLSGPSTYYGGGGGGGKRTSTGTRSSGGNGGGGAGGWASSGEAGDRNTGGGGGGGSITGPGADGGDGGGSITGPGADGGDGGSGVVVIRYRLNPDPPTSTSVTSGDGQMTLAYTLPTHTGGGTLSLEYQLTPSGGSAGSWIALGETDGSTVISSGVANGTVYSVKLRAKNTVGASSYTSSEVTVGNVLPSPVGEILRLDGTNSSSYSGSGSTWTDLARGNNGTINGATWDSRSKSFGFDGTNDEVDLPDLAYDFSAGLAIHAVVDFGSAENYETVLGFSEDGSTKAGISFGRYGTANELYLEIYDPAGTGYRECHSSSGGTAIKNGFHVYSAILLANGTCQLQVDGTDLTEGTSTGGGASATMLPASVVRADAFVGRGRGGAPHVSGSIQSLVVYNTAQTTPVCYPEESTFTGDGSIGESGVPYKVLQFATVGKCVWSLPSAVRTVDFAAIGGGGGGGAFIGGGGAGGQVYTQTGQDVSADLTVTVGAGGVGASNLGVYSPYVDGSAGGSSSIAQGVTSLLTAAGGSIGGGHTAQAPGDGVTGGGGGYNPTAGGNGSLFDGGVGYGDDSYVGGGGAGAGADGQNASASAAGNGGTGAVVTLTGSSVTYGGGGGGGVHGPNGTWQLLSAGTGGSGGGGNGGGPRSQAGTETVLGQAGQSGLGGGGGGAGKNSGATAASPYTSTSIGGAGGSGKVLLAYSLSPGVPAISSVSSGDGSLDVAFSAPTHTAGSAITDYEYSFDGSSWTSFGSASAGTKTISGLSNGTAYTVRVRAVNGNGNGVSATAGSSSTPRGSQTLSWSPANTTVEVTAGSVTLSPAASALGGVAVQYSIQSAGSPDASCAISDNSNPTVTFSTVGSCVIRATADEGGAYLAATTDVTLTVTLAAQTITFASIADKTYGDASFSATVSASSSLTVTLTSSTTSVCTVSTHTVTIVSAGTCTLVASQSGNSSYAAASSVTRSFTVGQKAITMTVGIADKNYDGASAATVSGTPTLTGLVSGDASYVAVDTSQITAAFATPDAGLGKSVSVTLGSGVLTTGASGDRSASYAVTLAATPTATISKISQASLSFTSATTMVFGQSLPLVATGGSGSGVLSYSFVSGPCTVSGSTVTSTGAGSCVVTATRSADTNYNSVTSSNFTITVSKAAQSINFTSSVPVSAVSGTTYTPTATASSALTVSIAITTGDPAVCSLSSGVVTFVASGTCEITATQGGDSDYNAASSVTQTIVAGKINQTITFPSISGKDFDAPAFSAGASVSSGRAVTYATSTPSVCAVTSSTGVISIKTIGDCTVTASSVGDASYAAASDVSRTFTISPVVAGQPSITSVSFGDSSVTVAFGAPGFVGGDAIDGYQVVATGSGGSVTKPDCATSSPCTITGLTNGTSYTLTVAAINAAGVGSASDASPAITPATIPDAVAALRTTPGNTELLVEWTALTNGQLGGGTFTRYDVYLRVNGQAWGTPVTPNGTNNLATQVTGSHTFTGLTNGTAYDVKVVAITSVNATALSSNTSTALGVPATAPDAPTDLAVVAQSNTTALASWTTPLDDGGDAVTAYGVNLSCSFVNPTDTFCELSGLSAGSRVTVTVGATNPMGTGATVSVSITMPGGSSGGSGSSDGGGTPAPTSTPSTPVVVPQRVIVPPQPTSIPRVLAGPVVSPGRGFDPNAGTRATIGGAPATVTKRPLDGGGVSVQAGAFQLGINLGTPRPSNTPGAAQSDVTVPTGQSTRVNGGGLLPGSQLQVWLPGMSGTTPKELARIPVKADGTFEWELSFTARQSETPIPIGRQVMQVTGYDEDGNQTVVDMTINIGQGAPTPEPNRTVNELPDLNPGQSLATSAGLPEIVTIEARVETREVAVLSGEWSFTVVLPENAGVVEEAESGATLTLIQARTASVSGDGFQPDTRVDIWLFSDPTLLGSVIVSADGSFTGEVYLDVRYAIPGEHTLQLQGVADDGFIKAANLGVMVQEPLTLTSESATGLLWWVLIAVVAVLVAVMLIVIVRRRLSRSAI